MRSIFSLLCAGALLLTLAACALQDEVQEDPSSTQGSQSSSSQSPAQSQGDASQSQEDSSQEQPQDGETVTLYIGSRDQFTQYDSVYEGELTDTGLVPPEEVVAQMAQLTGWNLDLDGEIFTGKGGITVTFAQTCSLFSGPPEEQKDEFHVYDSYQLDQTILDSVKKTLQAWAVVPGMGDPDSVDVYFCGPGGEDLVLEDLGLTISSTQPYESFPEA